MPFPQAPCYDAMDLSCGGRAFTGDGSVWGCWLVSSWAGLCLDDALVIRPGPKRTVTADAAETSPPMSGSALIHHP